MTRHCARRGPEKTCNRETLSSLTACAAIPSSFICGKDSEILRDEKASDSIARRMRVMNLTTGESDKGWMGEFNKTLRSRRMDRTRDWGVSER